MLEGLLGIFVGVLMIVCMRHRKLSTNLYGAMLITLPIIYAVFGLFAGNENAVWVELLYGLPFILVGVLCSRYSFENVGYLVGAFWLFHGGYDLSHGAFFINPGVPSWYPVFCAAVDLVVGIWLLRTVNATDKPFID